MTDWLCSFAFIAQLFCATASNQLTGYIEGESLFVAPQELARVTELRVKRGQRVSQGDVLAVLEQDDAQFAYQAAEAQAAEAQARLQNLNTGKRAEEIAVLKAAETAAKADLAQKELDLERATDLVARKVQSQSILDNARTSRNVASARLAEARANLQVAHIAARAQEIEAAQQTVRAARAQQQTARWRLTQRTVRAPQSGVLEEVLRYSGEMSGPSAPLFLLLPDARRKLRVFVPQAWLPHIALGDELHLTCDRCPSALAARVSFIASAPEFTPPVIYSVDSRQKLVVLVEAEPIGAAAQLAPGQIVDVTFPKASVVIASTR